MSEKKKPPYIMFYCKKCNKLGRQKDFIMPVKNLDGRKGISMACINCLHDKGYRFKEWYYGDKDETPRVHEDETEGGRDERHGKPS
tara:strand:- start:771 stop:1028 length:258 start_codon:yes stop_codon:yes gene_type:complete